MRQNAQGCAAVTRLLGLSQVLIFAQVVRERAVRDLQGRRPRLPFFL